MSFARSSGVQGESVLLAAAAATFAYESRIVVDSVSMNVAPGAIVGLLGANGAGKTTLLGLLAGLRTPLRGHVTLDGVDLSSVSRRNAARRLALVPQETHAAFDYTALEVVLMGRYPHLGPFEIEGSDDVAIARRALSYTDATAFEGRRFSTLSAGEKQRVVIAAALAQLNVDVLGPQGAAATAVMLLDEPTSSLDLRHQLELLELLRQLNARLGLAIVISTHDIMLAARLCHTLVFLREGRVLASGAVADTLTPLVVRHVFDVDADLALPQWFAPVGVARPEQGRA